MNPHHGLHRVGREDAFGASLGVFGFDQVDQVDQLHPRNICLHLALKTLPFGAFPRGGLLVITEGEAMREALTELLAAYETIRSMRLKGIVTSTRSVIQGIPAAINMDTINLYPVMKTFELKL